MDNNIELKSIKELLEMKFYIPNYQRGYRWTQQQVVDLLNDIDDFIQKQKNDKIEKDSFYCIQPLVVKEQIVDKSKFLESLPKNSNGSLLEELRKAIAENTKWEVIDGQQRLTTIYILLSYLEQPFKYSLEYATRANSKAFLENITKCEGTKEVGDEVKKHCENCENKSNECKCKGYDKVEIDYYHIIVAYATIKRWFCNRGKEYKDTFKDTLLKKVKFIWYESVDENPISVFTRLNIGKISLTNSELIKALILNRSNFKEDNYSHIRLKQQEIASEWDRIEYTLQNDEFWLFIHNLNYDKPTRIEFIFDLIANNNSFGLNDEFQNKIGTDQYRTFRYFYEFFNSSAGQSDENKIGRCWGKVKNIFQIFEEWYNDLELYHYVGYLIYQDRKLDDIRKQWEEKKSKVEFVRYLKERIIDEIKDCNDLDKQYEVAGPAKTSCKPLLLLHNIQTVVNQNNQLKSKEEYSQSVFYKFPFHLFKKENWDVEHIDSNTTNGLEKEKDQKEWLKYSVLGVTLDEDLKNRIKDFIQNPECESFEDLCQQIEKSDSKSWSNPEMDKNKIWNFVLLDAGTNRGYGNSIFPAKRRCIIGKDQGKKYSIDDSTLEVASVDGAIAFIPPVTKNVFLKYYNTSIDNLREWNESDAVAYKANILETLKEFGVTDSAAQKGDDNNE